MSFRNELSNFVFTLTLKSFINDIVWLFEYEDLHIVGGGPDGVREGRGGEDGVALVVDGLVVVGVGDVSEDDAKVGAAKSGGFDS